MKSFFQYLCAALLLTVQLSAQTTTVYRDSLYNWSINDVWTHPGERLVVSLNTTGLSQFAGMALVGQVIDNTGNWGDSMPAVGNFRMFIRVDPPVQYSLVQDAATPNILLRLRRLSSTRYALTALMPNGFKGVRVLFRYTQGLKDTLTMANAEDTISLPPAGDLLVAQPTYQTTFAGGNVGIGTNTPQEALSVNGLVRARHISVEKNNWPDYVFDTAYALMPLPQLQAYIRQHRHLPGIPAATAIDSCGLNLGEMAGSLTRTIEEFTLHLLHQEEEQKTLQHEMLQTTAMQLQQSDFLEYRLQQLEKRVKELPKKTTVPVPLRSVP